MRTLKTLATALLATLLVMSVSACGKKRNGSGATATPGNDCTWRPDLGIWECPNTPGTPGTCQNAYFDYTIQKWRDRTTHAILNVNCGNGGYLPPWAGQGPGYIDYYPTCDFWNYYYWPEYYVPVYIGGYPYGTVMCVNERYLYDDWYW